MRFRTWIRTIERQNRLRLPEEAVAAIPWLERKEPLEAVGFVGRYGQLQIATKPLESEALEKMESVLSARAAEADESIARWVELARFGSAHWPIKFLPELGRKRFALVLPRETRELDLVPASGMPIVLFVTGAIVELWKPSDWVSHLRTLSAELEELGVESVDQLNDRES